MAGRGRPQTAAGGGGASASGSVCMIYVKLVGDVLSFILYTHGAHPMCYVR